MKIVKRILLVLLSLFFTVVYSNAQTDNLTLKIENVSDKEVVLKSASSSLDFALTGTMNPVSESQTEVQLLFEGKFNPFIKMMVEKPLQNFINSLTDKIEQL